MTFAQRLQAFVNAQVVKESSVEVIRAFMIQLAASTAIASEKTGEDLDRLLDAICKNLRTTAHRCIQLEKSRRN